LKKDTKEFDGSFYRKLNTSTNYLNKLKCEYCGWVFHKEFSLESHRREFHRHEVRPKINRVAMRSRLHKKRVRGDTDDDPISDDDLVYSYSSDDDVKKGNANKQ
jgi:hypothetical protein